MRYIFAVILSLCLSSTSLAAAAAADTAPMDEKIAVAYHIQRLAQNNALWLQGFYVYFDNHAVARNRSLDGAMGNYKNTIAKEKNAWDFIAGNATD